MDIRQLYYFITIVEETTFTAASVKLNISQPSLSISIKKLEERLGLILLDRSKSKLTLTKEGQVFYKRAKHILNQFDQLLGEMERLKVEGPLELSIGLIESTNFWLSKILLLFKKEIKNVHIKLIEILGKSDVLSALNNSDIHIAITNQYISDERIKLIPIYEEKLVALLPPMHHLKNKKFIVMSDLKDEDFIITLNEFQTHKDILKSFQHLGIKPNIQFECERYETASTLVESGLGITIMPENYVKYSKNYSYHIKNIEHSNIDMTIYLAYVKNEYLPPLVEVFIELVKDNFSNKTN